MKDLGQFIKFVPIYSRYFIISFFFSFFNFFFSVDMYFCGHTHHYERSWPVYQVCTDLFKIFHYIFFLFNFRNSLKFFLIETTM